MSVRVEGRQGGREGGKGSEGGGGREGKGGEESVTGPFIDNTRCQNNACEKK